MSTAPLLLFAFCAAIGISAADSGYFRWPCFLAGFGVSATLVLQPRGRPRVHAIGALLAVASGFGVLHALHSLRKETLPFLDTLQDGTPRSAHVEGVVDDLAKPSGAGRNRFVLRTTLIDSSGVRYAARHRILVTATGEAPFYGDRLSLHGVLQTPPRARNPGEFDFANYLWRKGIAAELRVAKASEWRITGHGSGNWIVAAALRSRLWIADAITRGIEANPVVTGVIKAMVLGMGDEAPPDVENDFRLSGTLHIFAVSGLHVGICASLIWTVLKYMGCSRPRISLILIPCVFGYAFITGFRPSALRAATMASLFLLGLSLYRQPRLPNSLGGAALLILGIDTDQLFRPGFQLSFVVLIAIVGFTPLMQRPLRRWLYPDPFLPAAFVTAPQEVYFRWVRRVTNLATVSSAAWVGSLPLMVIHFGLVTPVAVVANVFLIPLGYLVLLLALASSGLAFLRLALASILLNQANAWVASGVRWLVAWFASFSWGHTYVPERIGIFRPPCEITLLDLPHGGAMHHIALRHHGHWLYDTGHRADFQSRLLPYVRREGIRRWEGVFLSHADSSHVSAAPLLFDLVPAQRALVSPWTSRGPAARILTTYFESSGFRPEIVTQGDRINLYNHQGRFEVLYPPRKGLFPPALADNQCLVVRFSFNGWSALFLADSGFSTETWLLQSGLDLRSDILVKGNHDSDFSGIPDFLDAVSPVVVILDSDDIPGSDRAAALRAYGRAAHVVDQHDGGAVVIAFRNKTLRLRTFLDDHVLTIAKRAR